jgi:type IV pilus assembly protein PilW
MITKLTSSRPLRAQHGYSMIELVVALTIGVFLVMGLFTVFQSQRQGSAEATGLAELEDEERLAMTILTDIIQSGGYFPDPVAEDVTGALPADTGNYTYAGGGQVFYGTTVAATSSDTMMVRFKAGPSDPIINCNGGTNTSTTASTIYVNYFQLTTSAQGVSQLGCAVGTDSTTAAAAPVMGLVNNVVGLSFAYALNTTGATGLTPATSVASGGNTANNKCPGDTYKTTANMVMDATIPEYDWTNVCAVRVSLTFTNPLYQPQGQPNPTPGQAATVTFERVIAVRGSSGMDMVTVTPPGSSAGSSGS